MGKGKPVRRLRGFVLPAALMFVVTLAGMSIASMSQALGTLKLAKAYSNQLTQRADLESTANQVFVMLLGRISSGEMIKQNQNVTYRGSLFDIRLRPAAARIDLNGADQVLLNGWLIARGASASIAQALSSAILDYRDEDSLTFSGAPETPESPSEQAPRFKNAPLDSHQELDQIPGFTGELAFCLAPDATVVTQAPDVDWRYADFGSAPLADPPIPQAQNLDPLAYGLPMVLEIVAQSTVIQTTRLTVEFRLSPSPARPIIVHTWEYHTGAKVDPRRSCAYAFAAGAETSR